MQDHSSKYTKATQNELKMTLKMTPKMAPKMAPKMPPKPALSREGSGRPPGAVFLIKPTKNHPRNL